MKRFFAGLILVTALAVISVFPQQASPGLKLVLTPSPSNPTSPPGRIVVTIEVKDAQGYSVPLYLSQLSATWNGQAVTVIPADENLRPELAAIVHPSEFTPSFLKRLQTDVPLITDETIQRTFSSPHTRFWVCRKNTPSGTTTLSVTVATSSGAISKTISMNVAEEQPFTAGCSSSLDTLTVSPTSVKLGDTFTATLTIQQTDVYVTSIFLHSLCQNQHTLFPICPGNGGGPYSEQCLDMDSAIGPAPPCGSSYFPAYAEYDAASVFSAGSIFTATFTATNDLLDAAGCQVSSGGCWISSLLSADSGDGGRCSVFLAIQESITISATPNPVVPWNLLGPAFNSSGQYVGDAPLPTNQPATVTISVAGGTPSTTDTLSLSETGKSHSGGHLHPPPGAKRPSGVFLDAPSGGNVITQVSVPLDSSGNGTATVYYQPTEMGGHEILQAENQSTGAIGKFDLTVQIPNLLSFNGVTPPTGITYSFDQGDQAVASRHGKLNGANWVGLNEFDQTAATSLSAAIAELAQLLSSQNVNLTHVSFNDMSVLSGGRFDLNATWSAKSVYNEQAHRYHRIGHSVDINVHLSNPDLEQFMTILRRAMKDHHYYKIPEGNSIHFDYYP